MLSPHPGLVHSSLIAGQLVNDTALRIVLLQGRTSGSTPVTALLQTYYPPRAPRPPLRGLKAWEGGWHGVFPPAVCGEFVHFQ